MMAGAILKVNESDFIAIMVKDKTSDIVHMNIGKQRNGASNISLDFKIDFSIFKFINGFVCVNKSKSDNDLLNIDGTLSFGGMGTANIKHKDIETLNNIVDEPKKIIASFWETNWTIVLKKPRTN